MVKPTGSEGLSIGRECNCAHISFVTVEKITYGLAGINRPETYRSVIGGRGYGYSVWRNGNCSDEIGVPAKWRQYNRPVWMSQANTAPVEAPAIKR